MQKKNRIKEFRFRLGFTQDDIYLRTEIWPTKISKIEREVYKPSLKEMELIAQALDCKVDEVFPSDQVIKEQKAFGK